MAAALQEVAQYTTSSYLPHQLDKAEEWVRIKQLIRRMKRRGFMHL